MSDWSVDAQHLQKVYKLYARPSDRLKEIVLPWGKRHQVFHALQDISFSLSPGQSLGIVGKNGSGKSTLLKILAGVLSPSSGTVSVAGTVGALLELGGGFNADLTGKENARLQMMLNGIEEKDGDALQNIVEFAELGDFIHQPVKKYSSGMFMRLAFACATAFEPQVLIVDEALAVGDAYFVRKCMNRMHDLLAGGTTLIFVSHDLEAVRRLCSLSLLLNEGEQLAFGPTPEVAEQYVALLHMQEQRHGLKAAVLLRPSVTEQTLTEALVQVQGAVDLAEQRLFVSGCWQWHTAESLRMVARCARQAASAAFRGQGNRLSLSFIRGGGFVLPAVYIDGKRMVVSTENDLVFFSADTAPPQIRNFTQALAHGEHSVVLVAEDGPVAWLGGEFCLETSNLLFTDGDEWAAALSERTTVYGDRQAVITYAELLDFAGDPVHTVLSGETVRFRIHARRQGMVENVTIGYKVHNRLSVGMFGTTTREEHYALNDKADFWVVEFAFAVPLVGGDYTISAAVASINGSHNHVHHYIDIARPFSVQNAPRRSIWGEFYNPTHITILES